MALTVCTYCEGIGRWENDDGELVYCEWCGGEGVIEYDY